MASTNEKHLDTFKTIPDFSSFRGRFELVTVPYLLRPALEVQIYQKDVTVLAKTKKIAPHSVKLLCVWAVMTRYKQPDPEYYESQKSRLADVGAAAHHARLVQPPVWRCAQALWCLTPRRAG
jgi:predicted Ser/Thr protein kinase